MIALLSRNILSVWFALWFADLKKKNAGTIIALHAFFRLSPPPPKPPVWESCMGAATLLRAKRNTRSRLLFIWPSGKKDLIFIKNREQYISPSHDFITSGYSSKADHTQWLDLKHLLCLLVCLTYYLNLRVHRIVDSLCQRCASQDFIRLGRVSLLAVTWTQVGNGIERTCGLALESKLFQLQRL